MHSCDRLSLRGDMIRAGKQCGDSAPLSPSLSNTLTHESNQWVG